MGDDSSDESLIRLLRDRHPNVWDVRVLAGGPEHVKRLKCLRGVEERCYLTIFKRPSGLAGKDFLIARSNLKRDWRELLSTSTIPWIMPDLRRADLLMDLSHHLLLQEPAEQQGFRPVLDYPGGMDRDTWAHKILWNLLNLLDELHRQNCRPETLVSGTVYADYHGNVRLSAGILLASKLAADSQSPNSEPAFTRHLALLAEAVLLDQHHLFESGYQSVAKSNDHSISPLRPKLRRLIDSPMRVQDAKLQLGAPKESKSTVKRITTPRSSKAVQWLIGLSLCALVAILIWVWQRF